MDILISCICVCLIHVGIVEAAKGNEEKNNFVADIGHDLTDRELILKLLDRVDDLEAKNLRQEHRIEVMENELSDQKKIIADQQILYDKIIAETSNQKQQIHVMKNSIKQLQRQQLVLPFESKSDDIQNEGEPIQMNLRKIIREANVDIGDKNAKPAMTFGRVRRVENEVTVAFFARLKVKMQHIGQNQNVVFEDVETNIGNAYNPHHGVFVAPVSGTYVFSASILADNNREVWCHYSVNGVVKAHIYARGTDNRVDQGSNTVILQLKQGDDVSVQNEAADDAVYGNGYSTISGFLYQQVFDSQVVG